MANKCESCGLKVDPTWKVCPYCGKPLVKKKPEIVEFSGIKFGSFWKRLSFIFSIVSIAFSLLLFDFFQDIIKPYFPDLIEGAPFIALFCAVISFSSYILFIDPVKKFSMDLEDVLEIDENVNISLQNSRKLLIVICLSAYVIGFIFKIFARDFSDSDDLRYYALIANLSFLTFITSFRYFTKILKSILNPELDIAVMKSFNTGITFSFVMGIGGSLYLSVWILIQNLIILFKKSEKKRKKKRQKKEYWDNILYVDVDNHYRYYFFLLFLFDLLFFFILFKDINEMFPLILKSPEGFISPALFLISTFISWCAARTFIDKERNKHFWYTISLILVYKVIIIIIISKTANESALYLREFFFSLGELNLEPLLLSLAFYSLFYLINSFFYILAEKSISKKKSSMFKVYFLIGTMIFLISFGIIFWVFILAISSSFPLQFSILFFLAMCILAYPTFISEAVKNYKKYSITKSPHIQNKT